ncbi:MAG: hypothetical protein ACKO4R_02980 [Synechococcales cyanobacterium]
MNQRDGHHPTYLATTTIPYHTADDSRALYSSLEENTHESTI